MADLTPRNMLEMESIRLQELGVAFDRYDTSDPEVLKVLVKDEDVTEGNDLKLLFAGYSKDGQDRRKRNTSVYSIPMKAIKERWEKRKYLVG